VVRMRAIAPAPPMSFVKEFTSSPASPKHHVVWCKEGECVPARERQRARPPARRNKQYVLRINGFATDLRATLHVCA